MILADHLGASDELNKLCDVDSKEIIDVSKLPYKKSVSQDRINELLISHAHAGKKVARLKGGDPFVFGRGFEEVQALAEAGIATEVIPGVTSAVSVPASAGVPVTQRGIVHAFTVVSGHLPPGHEKSLVDWAALARSGATLSVIMGVRNAGAIADALLAGGLAATTPVAIIENGTIDEERVFKTTLASMGEKTAEAQIVPPAVFVIGEVADLR
ncbi:uroporphyrinogen-III C-methyltransferase [Corynebacterium casei]|uniref:uroporphyrinogen-III C-methyltransferase n=1 Tax=Corynebacterium casei TaxID=160386 RepID=UPI00264737CF|nr:uroporphyrinogen-III C-methyltransferase [Corynebacterium casei]MDN5903039.1 uroporphyrinogen-III C-methyltransferase [Corynebacterium casei]